MKVSSGTCTRPVASRLTFARRFATSVMTLRVMPDARIKSPAGTPGRALVDSAFAPKLSFDDDAMRRPADQAGRSPAGSACLALVQAS
jgi:hypothetical protein